MNDEMIRLSEVGGPTVNWTVLEELSQYQGEGGNLAEELVQLFFEETPRQMLSLDRALQSSDFQEVMKRSHQLKGSAGAIGAERLRAICEAVEQVARERQSAVLEFSSAIIAEELVNLRSALSSRRAHEPARSLS